MTAICSKCNKKYATEYLGRKTCVRCTYEKYSSYAKLINIKINNTKTLSLIQDIIKMSTKSKLIDSPNKSIYQLGCGKKYYYNSRFY